jgi:hypothetical protein
MIFIDAAFANTLDLHNQIDYVICLTDDVHTNLIHWSSIKCKRVIKSVLTAELYTMINDFDVETIIKSIIERMLHISLSLILFTDAKSLFDCLIKLETTSEKRLIIDLMCFRQSYERREIAEIRWIDENINFADTMTKSKLCNALIKLIDINIIELKITEWVERTAKSVTIKIFDDQDLWWFNDLILMRKISYEITSLSLDEKISYDWLIDSWQSALIKFTRSAVTIATRQSIDETTDETSKGSNIRAMKRNDLLSFWRDVNIYSLMKAWSAITCWSRHWTSEFWIRSYSRSFVLRLVRRNHITFNSLL